MGTEERPVDGNHDVEGFEAVAPIQQPAAVQVENSTGIVEETSKVQNRMHRNLFPDVQPRDLGSSSNDVRINMPPMPSSNTKRVNFLSNPGSSNMQNTNTPGSSASKSKAWIKEFFPRLSFRNRNANLDLDKAYALAVGAPPASSQERPSISTSLSRSFSISKIFGSRINRTSSLPVTSIENPDLESSDGGCLGNNLNSNIKLVQQQISRSLSVPINKKEKSLKRLDSAFHVVPSTPQRWEGDIFTSDASKTLDNGTNNDNSEDIAAEEAVCRICLIELNEGGETLRMQCSCRGELALAHKECVIKWFTVKGNRTCDICKQEVQNLSVTLLRTRSNQSQNTDVVGAQQTDASNARVWQEIPVLVIVNMLAYFCFLEQLLVQEMSTSAIAISLPFSSVLGLLASIAASTMVTRRFVWVYASIQFVLVVLFGHVFYSAVHLPAILSIFLATFLGFGTVYSVTTINLEFFRWRSQWQVQSGQHSGSQGTMQGGHVPETANSSEPGPRNGGETNTRNHGSFSGDQV